MLTRTLHTGKIFTDHQMLLFSGIAEGLSTLEKLKESFRRNGTDHVLSQRYWDLSKHMLHLNEYEEMYIEVCDALCDIQDRVRKEKEKK